jgi:hypothetical protein
MEGGADWVGREKMAHARRAPTRRIEEDVFMT